MKKKLFINAACVATCLASVAGCGKNTEPIEPNQEDDNYIEIYRGKSTDKHELLSSPTVVNRASYGYLFNSTQGYNQWSFFGGNISSSKALFCDEGVWQSDEGDTLKDGVVTTDENKERSIIYYYKVPEAGIYSFNGTLRSTKVSNVPADVSIYKNNSLIKNLSIKGDDFNGQFIEFNLELSASDTIAFAIRGEAVYFNPSVQKGSLLDSLYSTHTPQGYYGDIHCYYYNDVLHMYHLWNSTGNDEGWYWSMQDTTDMFHYNDVGLNDSFVKNHYMSYGKDPDVFGLEYKSSRDRTYFFDEQVKRYRSIGLCYRKDGGCELALKTSDDELGFEWFSPSIALKSFPRHEDGEPECSQLFKMGNRWYLTTGISGQSQHGVGGLSYWIGDEGKTIDEVDWINKPVNRLDGEDLCVPQIEKVRNRYYMFGWNPSVYNGPCWGGYKNLTREVYQLPDGRLATRIDKMATSLMNKGRFFNLDACDSVVNNATIKKDSVSFNGAGDCLFNSDVNSTFAFYNVDMQDATEVTLKAVTPSYTTFVTAFYEGGKTYLKIYDSNNHESARVLLDNSLVKQLDCKVVIEKGNVEFAVNDTIVLTGRTGQTSLSFKPGFSANGKATISEININRLAQLYDVYD